MNDNELDLLIESVENSEKDNTELAVLGGAVAGILGATLINPVAGIFLFAGITGTSIVGQITRGNKRYKVLSGEVSPVALMDESQLQEYKELIGEENFTRELKYSPSDILNPGVNNQLKSIEIDQYNQVDPIEQLCMYARSSCLVLGRSGDGKDIYVSNAIRSIKSTTPDLKITVIDPKGTEHEKGYYQGVVDNYFSFRSSDLSDEDITQHFIIYFDKYRATGGLLIITESTLVGDAFNRRKDTYMQEVISKLVTAGNADGNNIWMLAQVPNLANLGIDSNARGQFPMFAVCHRKNIDNACNSWGRYLGKKTTNRENLKLAASKSSIDRCFYSPNIGEWLPMPKLKNYSGYDRDTHTSIKNVQPEPIQDKKTADEWITIAKKLREAQTTDIVEVVKLLYPTIENNQLNLIIGRIKQSASENNDQDILSKFSL